MMKCSSMVEWETVNFLVVGSNPTTSAINFSRVCGEVGESRETVNLLP